MDASLFPTTTIRNLIKFMLKFTFIWTKLEAKPFRHESKVIQFSYKNRTISKGGIMGVS